MNKYSVFKQYNPQKMYKPKTAIKTSFSFNLPYCGSKQGHGHHVKTPSTPHLSNQAAIRHTSSNNRYQRIFFDHSSLHSLAQTF